MTLSAEVGYQKEEYGPVVNHSLDPIKLQGRIKELERTLGIYKYLLLRASVLISDTEKYWHYDLKVALGIANVRSRRD